MNRIAFCGGESAGGIADTTTVTSKKETTGGISAKINQQLEPEVKLQTLDRDTVSFKGVDDGKNKKGSSVLGAIAAIGLTAAAAIVTLGYAKKLNWVDKISNPKVKDFVVKYGAEPSYKLCKSVKTHSTEYYNKAKDFFNNKKG